MQESIPVGAAEGRPLDQGSSTSTGASDSALDDPRALQILSTEHWSLLAGRSLAHNEAFSRAGSSRLAERTGWRVTGCR
jgi:hypothetical protein